jgi:hypothetical protein
MYKNAVIAAIAITSVLGVAACGGSSSDPKEGPATTLLQKNAALPTTTPKVTTTAPKTVTTPMPQIGTSKPTTAPGTPTTVAVKVTTTAPKTVTTPMPTLAPRK